MTQDFGGNTVRTIQTSRPGRHAFADGVYTYALLAIDRNQTVDAPDLKSYTVFVLEKPDSARVHLQESGRELQRGDALQIEDQPTTVSVESTGGVRLLLAGTRTPSGHAPGITVTPASEVYRVIKPWGHELWINGQHPNYALKEIAIKAGTKTSLQYHHHKKETNVLISGRARLHYKSNPDVPNDAARAADIGQVDLESVSVVDVSPPTVHRLEALTDVVLYEVSTPHLDDVVRIQDDAGRPDGRIAAEHTR